MAAAPKLPSGRAGLGARLAAPPALDRYQARAGSALTPQVASAVLRQADLGELERLADLLDEVRERDGHLQAVLSKREQQVAGAEWELRPANGRSKARTDKAVRFCTDALASLAGLADTLADLQSAVYHGRAVCEVVWRRDGRYWLPDRIEPVHPRRLRYDVRDWRLRLCDAAPEGPFGWPGVPVDEVNKLLPGKLLVHTPRIRGGYPTREGIGRVTLWYSGVFKAFGWRDFLALAEQYGRPIRMGVFGTGKHPDLPQASDEDVDELEEALDNLSSSLVAVFPDTTKPEFHAPPSSQGEGIHAVLVRLCDAEASKAALGGTLTTDPGVKGARSLGDSHKDEQVLLARGDAKAVAATLRRDLLGPMLELNGLGDRAEAPHVAFAVEPPEDLNALAERVSVLVAAGLKVPQAHVRDVMAIPDPAEGEDVLGVATPAPGAGEPAAPGKKPGKKPAKPPPAEDEDV